MEARKILVELLLKLQLKKCVFQNCCKKRTIIPLNFVLFYFCSILFLFVLKSSKSFYTVLKLYFFFEKHIFVIL